MNPGLSNTAALVGRLLLALIFITSGYAKMKGYAATGQYMASKGLPLVSILLPLTILTELGAGLLLAFGFRARWAALWLFLFLIPTTLIFHAFWGLSPEAARPQEINFMKNVAIMGGMLMVVAFGPGRYSLDRK